MSEVTKASIIEKIVSLIDEYQTNMGRSVSDDYEMVEEIYTLFNEVADE